MDFTIDIYYTLLKTLLKSGFQFYRFGDKKSGSPCVFLRHDVDARPMNSLQTAKIEHSLGINGTYYFRIVPESNQPAIIRQIASLGHEIGYHYEDLALCRGDMKEAITSFEKNLTYFRSFYPVNTICMHGSPLSKYDNRDLWKEYNYHNFGIIAEPYYDIDFTKVLYLTDTGRKWDGSSVSIRDKVNGNGTNQVLDHRFHTTCEIIEAARRDELPDQLMITIHPQRWTNNPVLWVNELVQQNLKNQIKKILIRRYNSSIL